MNLRLLPVALAMLAFCSGPALATDPPPSTKRLPINLLPLLNQTSTDALAGSLRGQLVHALPEVLYESDRGWGHVAPVPKSMKWLRHGEKKQGTWRKMRIVAVNPADTLIVDLRNLRQAGPGKLAFTVFLALDGRIDYQQQNWEAGLKLYDGSVRAHFRATVSLDCEATSELEPSGFLLPDAIFHLHVVKSDLHFDHIIVDHIAGVGGELAKLLGDTVHGSLRQMHGDVERNLLARANAAIVKAGDTKEVRVGLSNLFKNHQPADAARHIAKEIGSPPSNKAVPAPAPPVIMDQRKP